MSAARRRARPVAIAALAALTLGAPLLVPASDVDPLRQNGPAFAPPSLEHPLGTDENGVSVLAQVVHATPASLLVGLAATAAAVAIGAVAGILGGYLPRAPAAVLNRLTLGFLVLPQVPFAVAVGAVLPRGTVTLIVAVALTSWATVARTVRAGVEAVLVRPHVERVRALGAGHLHQLRAHVVPAVLPLLSAAASLTVANALLAEATLAFLGIGDPTAVSWGTMLRRAAAAGAATAGAWWCLLTPGIAMVAAVLAFGAGARAAERRHTPARGRT
ncbi:ABC transporter permease [Actinoplanes sp. NPDC051861]|uniref:ABC transporter permease n=1 Tax=Actinoplanes sp. NPDC051861 TaxID=3155170 RepID=UPI0034498756